MKYEIPQRPMNGGGGIVYTPSAADVIADPQTTGASFITLHVLLLDPDLTVR